MIAAGDAPAVRIARLPPRTGVVAEGGAAAGPIAVPTTGEESRP